MNKPKPTSMRLLHRLALAVTAVFFLVGAGGPALAASPTPAAGPSPSPSLAATPSPSANPSPKATPSPRTTPTPTTSVKPGVKPTLVPRAAKAATAAATAASASLAPSTCTLTGTTRHCDLWALTGTQAEAGLPDPGLPIWGFQLGDATAPNGPAVVPGPALIFNAKETVTISLHNQLPRRAGRLSLEISASNSVPDRTGIDGMDSGQSTAQSKSYSFGQLEPGTYLYEAGPTPAAPRQVRMGLAGVLIVRPAGFSPTNMSAYGGTGDVFSAEALAAINEFDPEFNQDPFKADPIDSHPSLFLLNGHAFDPTNAGVKAIDVGPGDVLLLRYANLGSHDRGLTILNERQLVLAEDSHVLKNPADVATKWTTPGQVSDAFVTIDAQAPLGTKIPVFESGFHLNNGPSTGLGGVFTYLSLVKGLAGTAAGPVSSVSIAAATHAGSNPDIGFTGTEDLAFSGTIKPSSGSLTASEWFFDSPAAEGTGYPITGAGKITIGGVTYPYSCPALAPDYKCTIPAATLDALVGTSPPADGDHNIWVHGRDGSPNGGWGVVAGDVFTFNMSGPDTSAMSVHSSPTNGSRPTDVANGAGPGGANKKVTDLVLLGSSTASLSDWVVLGGEYCLDSKACAKGSGVQLIVTPGPTSGAPKTTPDGCVPPPAPPGPPSTPATVPPPGGGSIVSFCGTVPLGSLSEGLHTLYVHAYEAPNQEGTGPFGAPPGRWGDYALPDASITFAIDKTGPNVGTVKLDPNPNNGTLSAGGNLNFLDSLQVTATITDPVTQGVNSNVVDGEVFLTATSVNSNPVPPSQYATGAEMIPAGGAWDSPTKLANAYIPLAELTSYPEGKVRFWVHALDIAGNWGSWSYADLTLDRTAPRFDYTGGATPADGSQFGPCAAPPAVAPCQVPFKASDPVSGGVNSNIVQAEWFVDPGSHLVCDPPPFPGCTPEVVAPGDPGFGNGTPITITPGTTVTGTVNIGNPPAGTKIVFRVKDAAGNWSRDSMVITK